MVKVFIFGDYPCCISEKWRRKGFRLFRNPCDTTLWTTFPTTKVNISILSEWILTIWNQALWGLQYSLRFNKFVTNDKCVMKTKKVVMWLKTFAFDLTFCITFESKTHKYKIFKKKTSFDFSPYKFWLKRLQVLIYDPNRAWKSYQSLELNLSKLLERRRKENCERPPHGWGIPSTVTYVTCVIYALNSYGVIYDIKHIYFFSPPPRYFDCSLPLFL